MSAKEVSTAERKERCQRYQNNDQEPVNFHFGAKTMNKLYFGWLQNFIFRQEGEI